MSVYRISSNTIPDNGVFHLKNREYSMDKINEEMNTGKQHRLPRENPVDVAQAMTFHTKIERVKQYQRNIQDVEGERQLVEGKMDNTIDLLQRARELAVQGANGIYSEDQRKMMAEEIDQILKAVIQNSNEKYKGNFLFSGYKKYTKPFEVLEGAVRNGDKAMITEVRYLGDNGKHKREVADGEYVTSSMPGSDIFWAEDQKIYSSVNTANFRLPQDMSIKIDDEILKFNAGDNIYTITDKINRSKAQVEASIDIVTGGLILKTTKPHKMELSDIEGGTLLQDLGVLEAGFPTGPDNYANSATVFGGSVFDVLIGLRNAMIENNSDDIGGRFLGGLDGALDNLNYHRAESGALSTRMQYLDTRMEDDKQAFTEALANIEDINVADTYSELKLLEFAHKASLSSLARLSQTSLMDFIR